MIILTDQCGVLRVVRQLDHAASCHAAARAWRRPALLPPNMWDRFLEAVRRHDDGWGEPIDRPLDTQGRPYDFMNLPTAAHVEVWSRSIGMAMAHDPYAGLLVAQHARRLYVSHPAEGAAADRRRAQDFINQCNLWIDQAIEYMGTGSPEERLAVEPRHLLVTVRLLAFLDHLTLMLAGALPWLERSEAQNFGTEQAELTLRRADGPGGAGPPSVRPPAAEVAPWPWTSATLPVEMPVRLLDRTAFRDAGDLAEALARAPVQVHAFVLRPGGR